LGIHVVKDDRSCHGNKKIREFVTKIRRSLVRHQDHPSLRMAAM
jgi:hypothetical protein